MTATEQLAAYRSRHVIAVLELPFVGVHQHLQAAGLGGGYSGSRHEHHEGGLIVGERSHVHSPELVCKVDGIRLVRAGSHRPWRHDPDEIKRLVKQAAADEAAGWNDPAIAEIVRKEPWQKELAVLVEREHIGFRVYSELNDIIRRALAAQKGS